MYPMSDIRSEKQIWVDSVANTILMGLMENETIVATGRYHVHVVCGEGEVLGELHRCPFD